MGCPFHLSTRRRPRERPPKLGRSPLQAFAAFFFATVFFAALRGAAALGAAGAFFAAFFTLGAAAAFFVAVLLDFAEALSRTAMVFAASTAFNSASNSAGVRGRADLRSRSMS